MKGKRYATMGKGKGNNHKPPIALWKPKEHDIYVKGDGKVFICNFDKVIDAPGAHLLSRFFIDKTSYEKQLDQISRYINYFINMYDDENELLLVYLRIKYIIDKDGTFNFPTDTTDQERDKFIDGFIEFVHGELFSDDNHIAENIRRLTEDNYLDDVEKNDGRKKVNEREYLESLEFTNEHIKIILMISFAMKILSPIMFHYLYMNHVKITKDNNLIYRFYEPLLSLFKGDHNVNIFNKLFVYVKSRVGESSSVNNVIFERRTIYGYDVPIIIRNFVKIVIISENMVKFSFPENWDEKQKKYKENIPGFLKTINTMVVTLNLSNCGDILLCFIY